VRAVTWNCHGATSSSKLWNRLKEMNPDVALLQEVGSVPDKDFDGFHAISRVAKRKDGKPQRFATFVIAKEGIVAEIHLSSSIPWVQRELEWFTGNLVGCTVKINGLGLTNLISVYSPAWPVDRTRIANEDTTKVKLKLNDDVWVADLLRCYLSETFRTQKTQWIVAGDFNLSETFDSWPGGPRGNREYLDGMEALGLTECLRKKKGKLTPTFLNTDKKTHKHQMDHLFVTAELASRLDDCFVGPQDILEERLSDHLPIIADFE
jgi:exonuclease III